ncbi:MAG: hypothetical protein V4513_02200 [Pseudomonadota bacterium]
MAAALELYVPQYGWQWWHPEWGGEFWTKDVDPSKVEQYDVHAMIDLGPSTSALDTTQQFNARDIISDLGGTAGLAVSAYPH